MPTRIPYTCMLMIGISIQIIRLSRLLGLDDDDDEHTGNLFDDELSSDDGSYRTGQMTLGCGHTIILTVLAALEVCVCVCLLIIVLVNYRVDS